MCLCSFNSISLSSVVLESENDVWPHGLFPSERLMLTEGIWYVVSISSAKQSRSEPMNRKVSVMCVNLVL